jgi:hypothetical protein
MQEARPRIRVVGAPVQVVVVGVMLDRDYFHQ